METWQERLPETVKYCRQDCLALHEAYLTYVTARATTYYNNRAFPSKVFPVTQSAAALDVFRNCYLEQTLTINEEVLEIERASYMGGISLVYGVELRAGLSCDINSSYPASMHNLMPTTLLARCNFEALDAQDGGARCARPISTASDLVTTNLYRVRFKFPPHCRYPSLPVRDTFAKQIHLPLESDGCECWAWGVALQFAISEQQCAVYVLEELHYDTSPCFRNFVQDHFEKRLEAKAAGDEVRQLMYKLQMNSCYGKFGQKPQVGNIVGSMQQLLDLLSQMILELQTTAQGDDDNTAEQAQQQHPIKVLGVTRLNTFSQELYQMQYVRGNERQTQVGSLCRLAGYITAVSRTILFQGMEVVNRELAPELQLVRYVDTDSIHLDLSSGFTQEQLAQLEEVTQLLQQQSDSTTHKEKVIADRVLPLYNQNPLYRKLLQLTCRDMLNIDGGGGSSNSSTLLIDAKRCGSFKLEHLILRGYFLGSKQYAELSINVEDPERVFVSEVCKTKGVQQKLLQFQRFKTTRHSITGPLLTGELQEVFGDSHTFTESHKAIVNSFVTYYKQLQFRVLDGGVRITQIFKYITPTLTKRRYHSSNNGETSSPFRTVAEAREYLQRQYQVNTYLRYLYRVWSQEQHTAKLQYLTSTDKVDQVKDTQLRKLMLQLQQEAVRAG